MSDVFTPAAEFIPEGQVGIARVERFVVSKKDSFFTSLRPREYVKAGEYTRLCVGGQLMMSDTHMEKSTNYSVVRNAHGRVLIAGLGLGFILYPILRKAGVQHVTVVEKFADVITLVSPHVASPKLDIVNADIHEWKPAKGERFNVIYFDIWSDQSTDDLATMARLHQRFKSYLDRGDDLRWMNSWRRDELKHRKQQEKRRGW